MWQEVFELSICNKPQKLFFSISFEENRGRQIIIAVSHREQSPFQVLIMSEVGCLEICFQNAEKDISA